MDDGISKKIKSIMDKKVSRRKFLKLAGYLGTAGAMLSFSQLLPKKYLQKSFAVNLNKKIKIGVLAPSHCALPIVNAHISGLYEKYGLSSEIVYCDSMPQIFKGLKSGDFAAGQLVAGVFYAIHTGSGPFKSGKTDMVSPAVLGVNGGVIVAKKDSGINSIEDLKGKRIGIHSPLMTHSFLLRMLLEKYRINPIKDATIKFIEFPKIIPALKDGEIDAFIHPEPLATKSLAMGLGQQVMITKDIWEDHPCCLLSMKKEFFERSPDISKQIALATIDSIMAVNNTSTRDEILSNVYKESIPYQRAPLKVLSKAFAAGRSDFLPFPYQSSAVSMVKMMKKYNIIQGLPDFNAVAKETFLSDYARGILHDLGHKAPDSNFRQEIIAGQAIYKI